MRNLGCGCNGKNNLGIADYSQYGDTPTNYDQYYDTASATVENLWNDVESAGVWAGNEISGFVTDLENPGNIPGNPMSAGYAAGQSARQAEGNLFNNIGSGVSGAVSSGFNGLLLLGGIGLAIVLLSRK